MLTKKQHELLMFINQRLAATGVAPSFDEMKDALRLRSKSGIHRLISGLEERGFIRRLPHRARALEVVKLPGEMAVAPSSVRSRFSPIGTRGELAGARAPPPRARSRNAARRESRRPIHRTQPIFPDRHSRRFRGGSARRPRRT